jgi:DeoR/GlpR family transcriptional regulator of sugar metabolism
MNVQFRWRGDHDRSERTEALLARIRERRGVTVSDLSLELGVSESTVRRELRRLSQSSALVRVYSGAKPAGLPSAFGAAEAESEEEVRIGRTAAELIRDGETVVLSSGTTTLLSTGGQGRFSSRRWQRSMC